MKVSLYAVLDSASGVYDGPVPAHNDTVALRNFTNMALDMNTPIGKNPDWYSLWYVGEWVDHEGTGHFNEKRVIAHAADLRAASYHEDDELTGDDKEFN